MDWTQTLTIIITIVGSMVAVWYAFQCIIKEDIKRHDIEFREMRSEFREMRSEFKEVHTLWANLLGEIRTIEKQIYEIKLDQSRKM